MQINNSTITIQRNGDRFSLIADSGAEIGYLADDQSSIAFDALADTGEALGLITSFRARVAELGLTPEVIRSIYAAGLQIGTNPNA